MKSRPVSETEHWRAGMRKPWLSIFGKDTCPYTQAARDHYAGGDAEYLNVKKHPAELARMLEYSRGERRVPVIVEDGKVTIGFGGASRGLSIAARSAAEVGSWVVGHRSSTPRDRPSIIRIGSGHRRPSSTAAGPFTACPGTSRRCPAR